MATDDPTLVLTPLAQPVNAFGRVATQMREPDYPTAESAQEANVSATWLEYLAKQPIDAMSREPLIILALARIASDGKERVRFLKVCTEVEALAEAMRAQNNGAPPPNGAGAGFSIKGGEVSKRS